MIRTRHEALAYLSQVSPDELRSSAKLAVDARIKALLSHAKLESLEPRLREEMHRHMLQIRSAFWERNPDALSAAGEGLRRIWQSGSITTAAEQADWGVELQRRLLALVEEVELALALESCTRARLERDWGAEAWLGCLLAGGPED